MSCYRICTHLFDTSEMNQILDFGLVLKEPGWSGGGPHLSGLEADGLQGSKGQVALVGELGEPTDDPGTEVISITYSLFQSWSRVHRQGRNRASKTF